MNSRVAALIARRVGLAVLFAVLVSSASLVLARLAPGDPATDLRIAGASDAEIARALQVTGFDRSMAAQVGTWVRGLVRLDLGESSRFRQPVAPLVAERATNTVVLATLALVLATLVGLPLGVMTGAAPRGLLAMIVAPVSTALVACPPVIGALGLLLFAVSTGALSAVPGQLLLPTLALALPLAATLERLQSRATLDRVSGEATPAAAARGIPRARWLWRHVARHASRPVLGVYGVIIGGLFSGSLAVETVTSWPGLGRLLYEALLARDAYLTAGCVLAGAFCLMLANLAVDLARLWVDPRLRPA